MKANQRQNELNDYAKKLIRFKARQLIGKVGFIESDRQDLEQEMTSDLLERLPKFDPNKAAQNTFVARVIERKISKLIRYRTAEMRDYRRVSCSLNDEIRENGYETIERSDTIGQDECDIRMRRRDKTREEQSQLRIDVFFAISKLPEDLRQVADKLKVETVSEAARSLGVPRSTLYGRIERLRLLFEDDGLRDYL